MNWHWLWDHSADPCAFRFPCLWRNLLKAAAAGFLCRVDWLRPSDVYGVNLNQIRALRLSDETGPQQHSLHHAAAWRGAQRSKCACEIDASVSESILPPSSRLSGADEQQRSSKCRICYSERCHLSRVVWTAKGFITVVTKALFCVSAVHFAPIRPVS
jgi:hypothetical protein